MDAKKETQCPDCESYKTRVRIKTGERVCEHCGKITKIVTQVKPAAPEEYYGG